MEQYHVTLNGMTPIIMHNDNLTFADQLEAWRNEPENKSKSKAGDDRHPAWTWLGAAYHNGKKIVLPSDNIMTMLREAGAKVPTGRRTETYKKQTQSGLFLDKEYFDFFVGGQEIPWKPLRDLMFNSSFAEHVKVVEDMGFELLVKRAKIGQSKHVRVRPLFRNWSAEGTVTVIDQEQSGLTEAVLQKIFNIAGSMVGLCDWRPSSRQSPGSFGKFTAELARL